MMPISSITLLMHGVHLVLQGSADLQGYGNDLANAIFGSSGNDLLDGSAGADWMSGGQGNDAYFVDNPGDLVTEQPGEGTDTVYASAHYRLGANVEYLVLQGTADLQGYGNDQSNAISGNSGSNVSSTAAAAPTCSPEVPATTHSSSRRGKPRATSSWILAQAICWRSSAMV
jgi:Ca2+-binding RTX toxin-like protein